MRVRLSPAEEALVRDQAVEWVRARNDTGSNAFHYKELARVPLPSGTIPVQLRFKGIWKPASFAAALSITTTFTKQGGQRPYDDAAGADSLFRYKWRGDDPNHADNRALREAMRLKAPLIWFVGIDDGWYVAVAPVWLVAEEPGQQQFVVAMDDIQRALAGSADTEALRAYSQRVVEQRVHQRFFRERVLRAYASHCAVCRLAHPNLLDAAHIIGDREIGGDPAVTNGMAMCKIHHAAFDQNVLGISPDLVVGIRRDILDEKDGPMLQHGLQDLHGRSLLWIPAKPRDRPDRDRLAKRFREFVEAAA